MAGFDTAFDDLPAVKPMATDGLFDDLPDAPTKRKVGPVEAFGRSMGDSIAAVPDFLNEAAAALLRPVDSAIGSDLSGALTRPTGPVKQARAAYKLDQQTEQLDGAGAQLAQGLGPLPRDLVAAMLTSGLSAPAAATVPTVDAGLAASLKALVPEFQQGAKAMMVPGALSSRDAYNEARVAGADPMQAAAVGTVRGVGTVAQGALPMAKAGNMATRVASGIPLAVLPNRVQMQAENIVAPEAMQHQPAPTDDMAAAIPGMILAGLLGPRAGRSTYGSTQALADPAAMATDRMRYDTGQERAAADAAQLATDLQRYGPILEANGIDPNSTRAQGVIANLKARAAAKAQTQAEAQAETVPPSPEQIALAQRQQPPATIVVEPTGVNGSGINENGRFIAGRADAGEQTAGVKASMLDQAGDAALQDKQAGQAFDLADRRQRQADADLANNGQIDPDYQGGGAAARYGEFNQGARPVTLLDGVQDVTRFASKDGKATVEFTDDNGETHRIVVNEERLRDVVIPANQRMAQDFNARSDTPPTGSWKGGPKAAKARAGEGVGIDTMASENMPRRSTDRIAGDQYGGRATPYNPNPLDGGRVSGDVLPPDAGTSVAPGGRRAGDTVEGTAARPTAGFDAPNEQRQIGAPPRQIGERSRFATDEKGRTVDRENRQPLAGEGRPLARQQTTNEQTVEQTNKQTQQTDAPINHEQKGAADGQVQKATQEVLNQSVPDAVKKKSASDIPPQASQLLADIRKRGGIDPKESLDLTGDNAFHAGQRMRGVFKKGGMSADGLLELMQQRQWLGPDATIAEARAMVNDAFNRREITSFDGLSDNVQAREAEARWQEHQERMASDPEYRAEQERLAADDIAPFDVEQTPKVIDEADLATEYVARFGEDALESLAIQHVDSADNFYNALRSELDGQAPKPAEGGTRSEGEAKTPQDGSRSSEQANDFALEQHGDAELRQRERDRAEAGRAERALAAEVAAKEAKAKAEREAADVAAKVKAKAADPDNFVFGEDKKAAANPERNLFDQPAPKAAEELHAEAEKVRNGLSGAGTLHSNPIGEVVKFLGKITGFTDPEYHAQFKEQTKKIVESIRSIGKPKESAENAVAAVARIIAFSNQGRLQTLENIYKSAAIKKLRLLIDRDGGRGTGQGEVYGSALDRNTTKFGNRLYDALGGMKAPELEQLTKLLQNRASIKPGTKLHDAATAVAKLLDDVHAYALEGGVSLGLHKDYFPRVDDSLAIMADPLGYKKALAQAYMKTDPSMSAQDARAAAEARFKQVAMADVGAVEAPLIDTANSMPNQNFTKSRKLSKEADEIMRPYLIQDPVDTLHSYIHKVVRRVEFERRFGGEAMLDGSPLPKSFEKARDQNMNKGMTRAEAVAKAEDEYNRANPGKSLKIGSKLDALMEELRTEGNAAAQQGVIGALRSTIGELPAPNTGRGLRNVTSWMQALTVVRYLRHAPFTSLSEPAMAMGATGRLSDVPKAYAGTVADITRRIGQKWLGEDWMKGSSSQNAHDIAKMLGVVGSHAEQMSAMLQQAGGVGEGSRLASLTANKAVHLSGLRAFTDATRVSMTNIGMSFLESISAGALRGEKLDSFHLRDLGLSEAEIPAFAKFVTDTGPMTVGKLTGADKAMAERYGQVLYNLTTKVILAPTAAEKPKFANHPVGRVAYSLMSYMMSFQQNVITPAYRKAKKAAINDEQFTPTERIRLLAPIASLALGGMIQYALLPFRQAMYGTDEDRKKKPKTEGEKIMEAASRAGLAGAADPLFNMAVSAKYERDPATMALGPVGGDVSKLAMDIAKFPTDRNSDNTNTHERQTAKDFYNVIVDPALSLAAQQLLPGPTAVLATQALGHKAVKESFVSAAAGEDKRNSQQQRQW